LGTVGSYMRRQGRVLCAAKHSAGGHVLPNAAVTIFK
jgi:hypothetical protein